MWRMAQQRAPLTENGMWNQITNELIYGVCGMGILFVYEQWAVWIHNIFLSDPLKCFEQRGGTVQRGGSKQSHVVVSLLTDDRNVSRQKRIYSFSVVLRDQSFMTFILSLKAERPVFNDGPSHLLIKIFCTFSSLFFSFASSSTWLRIGLRSTPCNVQCCVLLYICPGLTSGSEVTNFFRCCTYYM